MRTRELERLSKKLKKDLSISERLILAESLLDGSIEKCEYSPEYVIYTGIMWDNKLQDYREITEEDQEGQEDSE